jgi:hemolysin activation/secretion protein
MRGIAFLIAGGLVSAPSFAIPAPEPTAEAAVVTAAELPFAAAFEDAGGPVREVALAGVTRYAPAELLRFAVAHEHAARGRSTVGGTVEAIELIYREDGFLLAEARASFDPRTGRLAVEVVEGQVDELAIEGLRPKVARQVERYLRPVLGRRPLREGDFERAFMLASDLTGVYVRSEFAPADPGRGTSLKISGVEDRGTGSFSVDNVPLRPDSAGRAYVVHEQRGLGVGGDMLRVFGSLTLGPESDSHALAGTVFYRAPVGSAGTYVEAFAGNAFSSRQFAQVTPNSEQLGLNAAVAVGHPVKRNLSNYVYVIGEVEYANATSRTGDDEFDSTTTAGRAYLVQGYSFPRGGLFQWSLEASAGVRPDRPAGQPEDGAKEFFHARAGVGLVSGLPFLSDRAYLRFEAAGQWAGTRLPEVEQFGLGFQPRLRGYVPYEVEGDRGFASTLELSYIKPVAKGLFRELMPFAFAEAGGVETVDPQPGQDGSETLYSAGGGIRLQFARLFSAAAWVGVPLVSGPYSEAGDAAFYLRLSKAW